MLKQLRSKYVLISLFSLVFGVTSASAATGVSMLAGPFGQLFQMLRNQNIVYGLTFIFYFMLFYGIYAAALKFVPVFKNGDSLGHQGKVVAIALSGLTLLALFVLSKGSITQLLEQLLSPFGVFGGLLLAALFAGITYFGIRGGDPNSATFAWVATASAIGMILAGMILLKDNLMSWGFLILLISLPIALFANRKGGSDDTHGVSHGHDSSHGGHDDRDDGSSSDGHGPSSVSGHGLPAPRQVQNFRGVMRP